MVSASLSCSLIFVTLVVALRSSPGDRQLSRRRVVIDQPLVTGTDAAQRHRLPPYRTPTTAAAAAAERCEPPSRSRPVQATARRRYGVPIETNNDVISARRQTFENAPSSSSPSSAAAATAAAAASRQEAAERVHVVHEGNAFEGD